MYVSWTLPYQLFTPILFWKQGNAGKVKASHRTFSFFSENISVISKWLAQLTCMFTTLRQNLPGKFFKLNEIRLRIYFYRGHQLLELYSLLICFHDGLFEKEGSDVEFYISLGLSDL